MTAACSLVSKYGKRGAGWGRGMEWGSVPCPLSLSPFLFRPTCLQFMARDLLTWEASEGILFVAGLQLGLYVHVHTVSNGPDDGQGRERKRENFLLALAPFLTTLFPVDHKSWIVSVLPFGELKGYIDSFGSSNNLDSRSIAIPKRGGVRSNLLLSLVMREQPRA